MKRRKTVLTILGAIVASSLLSIGCNKTNADQGALNPSGNCSEGSCSFPGRYAGGQTDSSKCRGSGVYQNENMNQQNMNAPNQGPASGQGQGQMGGSNMGNNPNMMGGTRGYAPNQGPSSNQEPSQMGDSNMMMRKPNPLNIERIKGEVIDKKSTNNGSEASLVMIVLRTPNEDVKVILGPSSYLDRSRLGLQIGDTVEIKGSRMQVNGTEMMIASEISKGGNSVPLRNEQGNPSWQDGSGMMPQQQQPYRYNSGMMPQQQPYRYDNNYNTNGSGYYYNNYNYDANRGGNYYNQGCSSGRCGQQY